MAAPPLNLRPLPQCWIKTCKCLSSSEQSVPTRLGFLPNLWWRLGTVLLFFFHMKYLSLGSPWPLPLIPRITQGKPDSSRLKAVSTIGSWRANMSLARFEPGGVGEDNNLTSQPPELDIIDALFYCWVGVALTETFVITGILSNDRVKNNII